MISKELFVEVINDVMKCDGYHDWLNKQLQSHGVDGFIFQPTCVDSVLKILHNLFGKADSDEAISYFCFELNYGKKWKEGIFKKDGNDVDLSTPENLYDYLISQSNKGA